MFPFTYLPPSYLLRTTVLPSSYVLARYRSEQNTIKIRTKSGKRVRMSEVLEAFHAEFAPTVLLVVEGVFLEQLVAPFLQAAFAPVLFPKLGTGIAGGGAASGFVNLVEAFPARRGKGCGKEGKAVFGGIAGGFGEAQGKALQAARTAFGLVFQPQHLVAPGIVVVVGVNKVQPLGGDKADGLVIADFVFPAGVDVGIAVEHGGAYAVGQHTFDDGRRAGCTARMQQYGGFVVGWGEWKHGCYSV